MSHNITLTIAIIFGSVYYFSSWEKNSEEQHISAIFGFTFLVIMLYLIWAN
jgi:hypothetical protein